ncbi:MAG: hypothetical protein KGM24_07650, partial [Elusimicrobia bacterium]|nr:hypothetical protein [Elusimicrobiota bacterium]
MIAAALGAAGVLAAMLFASRAPAGADFLLPRRGGWALFRAVMAVNASPAGRLAFELLAALALLACAAGAALSLRRAVRRRPASWSARLGLAMGPLFAALLAARLLSRSLDLLELVWFPYGGADAFVLPASAAIFALALVPAALAAREWAGGRRRRASLLLGALIALDLGGGLYAAAHGVGRVWSPPPGPGKTLYAVLVPRPRASGAGVYVLAPDVFSDGGGAAA